MSVQDIRSMRNFPTQKRQIRGNNLLREKHYEYSRYLRYSLHLNSGEEQYVGILYIGQKIFFLGRNPLRVLGGSILPRSIPDVHRPDTEYLEDTTQ